MPKKPNKISCFLSKVQVRQTKAESTETPEPTDTNERKESDFRLKPQESDSSALFYQPMERISDI